jgi:hypothetical protein
VAEGNAESDSEYNSSGLDEWFAVFPENFGSL